MAIAVDTASESHAGTTGSASEASFTWNHTFAASAYGCLIWVFENANADSCTGVTVDGVAATAVPGGRAVDTAGEPRSTKAYFLGGAIASGSKAIVVSRTNNANVMYAVARSFTAARACAVYPNWINLTQTDAALAIESVDTGHLVAIRCAAVNSALNAVPAVGAGTTAGLSIDFGTSVAAECYETTGGAGARSMGFSDATSDDVARVSLGVFEIPTGPYVVGWGSPAGDGTGAITPGMPSMAVTNDILALVVQTANEAATITGAGGGTWTEMPDSPQGTGTAAASLSTRLTVFWSRYDGSQTAPTVGDAGDHTAGRIFCIRNCPTTGNPYDVTSGGTEASDNSLSATGDTTTVADTLVLIAAALGTSGSNFAATWTNADLGGLTPILSVSVASGVTGRYGVAAGTKAAAGAYGATTNTLTAVALKGFITIAFKPASTAQDVSPALLSQLATVTAPVVTQAVAPALHSQLATAVAPAVTQRVVPALLSQLATVTAPSTIAQSNLSPALLSQPATPVAPNAQGSSVFFDSDISHVQLAVAVAPGVVRPDALPPLLSQLASATAPAQVAQSVAPALHSQVAAGVAPTFLAPQQAAPGLLSQLATTIAPAIFRVEPTRKVLRVIGQAIARASRW